MASCWRAICGGIKLSPRSGSLSGENQPLSTAGWRVEPMTPHPACCAQDGLFPPGEGWYPKLDELVSETEELASGIQRAGSSKGQSDSLSSLRFRKRPAPCWESWYNCRLRDGQNPPTAKPRRGAVLRNNCFGPGQERQSEKCFPIIARQVRCARDSGTDGDWTRDAGSRREKGLT
jgi:hypothetical protein